MNVRTFLIIVLGFLVVTALAVALLNNLALLEQPFEITADRSVPIWGVVVAAFLLGLMLSIFISILQDSRRALGHLRSWWGARTRRANEERYRRGIEALLGGDHERALAAFSEVLAHDPDHFDALMVSGDALRGVGRHEEAVERHRRARRLRSEDLRPLYSLASDYEDSEQYPQARLALAKIVELEPKKSVSALRRLRMILMKAEDWEGALKYQERIEALTEKKAPHQMESERRYGVGIRYQIAAKQASRNQAREAVGSLRKVLRVAPDFVPAHLRLGEIQRHEESPDAAVETWREGFRATRSPILLTAMENHFLEMEDPQVAIDTFRDLIHDAPDDVMPRFFLGKLFLRLEMIDEAYGEFEKLRRRMGSSPALHFYMGKTLDRRRDFTGAAAEFERALDQADLLRLQYECTRCAAKHRQWVDRCENCGEWNTVAIDLKEDRPVEELGLSPTPVYTAS